MSALPRVPISPISKQKTAWILVDDGSGLAIIQRRNVVAVAVLERAALAR